MINANTRREKVAHYLTQGYNETEIAKFMKVSRQTIVRDVAELKKESRPWLDDLAKNGFIFEYRLGFEKLKETASRLESLYHEAKTSKEKLAILKQKDENTVLYLKLLSESPTIHSLRKAVSGNISQA